MLIAIFCSLQLSESICSIFRISTHRSSSCTLLNLIHIFRIFECSNFRISTGAVPSPGGGGRFPPRHRIGLLLDPRMHTTGDPPICGECHKAALDVTPQQGTYSGFTPSLVYLCDISLRRERWREAVGGEMWEKGAVWPAHPSTPDPLSGRMEPALKHCFSHGPLSGH